MRLSIPGTAALAAVLIAAAPAPKPVISIDGVAAAVKLDAAGRSAIARQVTGLNAGLLKFVALHRRYASASSQQREQIQRDMAGVHEQCKALHDAISEQLDPTQRAAFFAYLHAQLKAAGIDMSQFDHSGMMPDSAHDHGSAHAAMAGSGHGS